MIKQIILALLLVGISYQQTAAPACAAGTDGAVILGVCYYKYDHICATWTGTAGCTGCNATGTLSTTPNADTNMCACAASGTVNVKSDGSCVADAAAGSTITPPTTGFVQTASTKSVACHATCKTCVDNTDAKCITCWADGTGGVSGGAKCAGPTGKTKLVEGIGYFAECPAGYVESATANLCARCKFGCAKCANTDLKTCTGCAAGHLLASGACTAVTAANGATGGCDATCGDKKCQDTATNCTECAAGHAFSAAGKCVRNSIPNCKTYAADGLTCTACEDTALISEDKKKCDCKSHLKYVKTDYKAGSAAGVTPVVATVFWSEKCDACGVTCAEKSVCKPDATDAKNDKCEAPAPVNNAVTCTDETLKLAPAACAECDATKKECTKCINDAFVFMTDKTKGCECKTDTFRKGTDSFECAALGTFDKTTCKDGKVAGWDATAKAVGCVAPPAAATTASTNGLLLSAISMIAALILA